MEVLGITSVDEWPSNVPEDGWLCSNEERQKQMDVMLSTIIEKFINVIQSILLTRTKYSCTVNKY